MGRQRRRKYSRKQKREEEPRYSRHHRKCVANNGSGDDENISVVPEKKHRAWHMLFSSLTPHEIADYISEVWIEPKYRFIVEEVE